MTNIPSDKLKVVSIRTIASEEAERLGYHAAARPDENVYEIVIEADCPPATVRRVIDPW